VQMKRSPTIPGKIVSVNGHDLHVFADGHGADTLVFMAGSGTVCPVLDFKPLWSLLNDRYRIAVIDKSGYGWSEPTDNSRDVDTMLHESREALRLAGLKAPYILVPHSMSSLEALYWAQTYPDEVKAIVGLDAIVPDAYDKFKAPSDALFNIIGFFIRIGLHRPFARLLYKQMPIAQSGRLNQPDSFTYVEMVKKSMFTSDMRNEGRYLIRNKDKVKNGVLSVNTSFLLFISN
ncbi:MAG TPA: alpha/beta hydrolase, partial [Ruminococcaceae bacterium]|nr:alpha/beta hydrolase [Oscillospiraceae bacterium]